MKLILKEIYPGIIHVMSLNHIETQKIWMRFEESYENPVFEKIAARPQINYKGAPRILYSF